MILRFTTFLRQSAIALFAVLVYISPVYAAAPANGSITPASGSSNPGQEITFTTTFTDADGWQNLQLGYLLISTSTSAKTNCFYAYYNQNANKLYLRNDANTAWVGGFAPGSANTIQNSYVSLKCNTSTVSGAGSTMTVTWKVTFKSTFTGAKNCYLSATDDGNATVALTKKGMWTIAAANVPPALASFAPSSGSSVPDAQVTFTSAVSDANGVSDIQSVFFIINTGIIGAGGMCAYYDRNGNKFYLLDDNDTAWLGGYAPGSANTIENSQVKLYCSASTASGTGTTLTVTWRVSFKAAYAGDKNSYLYVADNSGATTGWLWSGTWSITGNLPPSVGGVTPATGSSNPDEPVSFSAAVTDANGWQDVQYALFIVNSDITGANGLCAYFNQNENKIYLRDDGDTAWLGGYAPGSAHVIENSYVKLDCAATAVSGTGNTMTVNWNAAFKAAYSGGKNSYLYAADDAGETTGWVMTGSWDVLSGNVPPQVDSVSPSAGSSSPNQRVVFTTTVSDAGGRQDINYIQFFVNEGLVSAGGFAGYYVQNENKFYLLNDDGSDWLGGYAPGAANVIENSYVKLECAQSAVSGSGNTLIVTWAVTFKQPCVGEKAILVAAGDDGGEFSGWYGLGSWSVIDAGPKERIFIYMNGKRVAMEENGQKYFFHNDHLGSTSVMTDANGQQVKYLDYRPFGETKTEEGSLAIKKKFTGKELDDSTGLINNFARLYDPKVGRFISADPIDYSDIGVKVAGGGDLRSFLSNPQNINRFSYCVNNPVRYVDPDGLLTIFVPGTWSKPKVFKQDFIKAVKSTFAENHFSMILKWSGRNTNQARVAAARDMISFINNYKFAEGEKLNIIGHSHGGNVGLIASQSNLSHKIDNLVTLGTPARADYRPNMDNIRNFYNVYSPYDQVQVRGGLDAINLSPSAIRQYGTGVDISIPIDRGFSDTHSMLHDSAIWKEYVDAAIHKE